MIVVEIQIMHPQKGALLERYKYKPGREWDVTMYIVGGGGGCGCGGGRRSCQRVEKCQGVE